MVRSNSGSARELGKSDGGVSEETRRRRNREASERRRTELLENSNLPIAVKMRSI